MLCATTGAYLAARHDQVLVRLARGVALEVAADLVEAFLNQPTHVRKPPGPVGTTDAPTRSAGGRAGGGGGPRTRISLPLAAGIP